MRGNIWTSLANWKSEYQKFSQLAMLWLFALSLLCVPKNFTCKNFELWKQLLSRATSGPEFCVIWLRKMPASGWGSLWESSSFVPWFSTFVFWNVSRTVPVCVRICGFRRNSSNLDRAPKMRDSVRLNSWDSFLVTLLSISSETCVIYSSFILGTDVFSWLAFPRIFFFFFLF